jgi:DNA-directed RNA polymerase beta subunit
MQSILDSLDPYEFELVNGEKIKVNIETCEITAPKITTQIDVYDRRIFPAEARQRAITYAGNCTMTLQWSKNDVKQAPIEFDLGAIPVMIRVNFAIFCVILFYCIFYSSSSHKHAI